MAIFDEVYEGEIATGLLRSAGIPAFLQGHWLAKYDPIQQRAWGGVRLPVPESCASDAREIMAAARSGAYALEDTPDIDPPNRSPLWTVAAVVSAIFGFTETGSAFSGLRRRRTLLMWAGTLLAGLVLAMILYVTVRYAPARPLMLWVG